MDDGGYNSEGLTLATHGFDLSSIELLRDTLTNKFGLKVTIQRAGLDIRGNQRYRLRVWAESMDLLRSIVGAYIIPSRPSATARGGTRRPRLVEADSYTREPTRRRGFLFSVGGLAPSARDP